MTYEMIRSELDDINANIDKLKAPHFMEYGENRKEEFLADYADYDASIRELAEKARAKGFIRLFNGRYKLNPAQVAL